MLAVGIILLARGGEPARAHTLAHETIRRALLRLRSRNARQIQKRPIRRAPDNSACAPPVTITITPRRLDEIVMIDVSPSGECTRQNKSHGTTNVNVNHHPVHDHRERERARESDDERAQVVGNRDLLLG